MNHWGDTICLKKRTNWEEDEVAWVSRPGRESRSGQLLQAG